MNSKDFEKMHALSARALSEIMLESNMFDPKEENGVRIIHATMDIHELVERLAEISADPDLIENLSLEMTKDALEYLNCVKSGLTEFISDFKKRCNNEKY